MIQLHFYLAVDRTNGPNDGLGLVGQDGTIVVVTRREWNPEMGTGINGSCTLAMFVCDNARNITIRYHLPYLLW
jgi:hypothetical protein